MYLIQEGVRIIDSTRNLIYDKFLIIEGWAYRGKVLVERQHIELAKRSAERIWVEIKELMVLLKLDFDMGDVSIKKKKMKNYQ